jgi:hypothetical protein
MPAHAHKNGTGRAARFRERPAPSPGCHCARSSRKRVIHERGVVPPLRGGSSAPRPIVCRAAPIAAPTRRQ